MPGQSAFTYECGYWCALFFLGVVNRQDRGSSYRIPHEARRDSGLDRQELMVESQTSFPLDASGILGELRYQNLSMTSTVKAEDPSRPKVRDERKTAKKSLYDIERLQMRLRGTAYDFRVAFTSVIAASALDSAGPDERKRKSNKHWG